MNTLKNNMKIIGKKLKDSWIELMYAFIFMLYTPSTVMASSEIWTKLNATIKDVYVGLLSLSTGLMVAIVIATTLIGTLSQNVRSVDSAFTWRKRAVLGWILINSLGFLVAYGESILSGGQYNL